MRFFLAGWRICRMNRQEFGAAGSRLDGLMRRTQYSRNRPSIMRRPICFEEESITVSETQTTTKPTTKTTIKTRRLWSFDIPEKSALYTAPRIQSSLVTSSGEIPYLTRHLTPSRITELEERVVKVIPKLVIPRTAIAMASAGTAMATASGTLLTLWYYGAQTVVGPGYALLGLVGGVGWLGTAIAALIEWEN